MPHTMEKTGIFPRAHTRITYFLSSFSKQEERGLPKEESS